MARKDKHNSSYNWVGNFLVSMPHMADPYFSDSVILLCGKDEEGAIGFIINQRIHGVFLKELFEQLKVHYDPDKMSNPPLFLGGPIDMERGFVIHSEDFQGKDTLPVFPGVCLSNSLEILRAMAQGLGPKHFIVCMGFASWDKNQLEKEISENSWLLMPASKKLLFTKNSSKIWKLAYEQLKVDPALVSFEGGQA